MADRSEFDDFVASRSPALLCTAYLLTGDRGLAEDLLQTALAKSWFAWGRISGPPEPYVRRVIATTYATWWRRRWRSEYPTGELPERSAAAGTEPVDERDALWRALGALPRAAAGRRGAPLLRGPVRGGDRGRARHQPRHREEPGLQGAGRTAPGRRPDQHDRRWTVIEDDLRSLLAERARELPDNPARPAEVRSRISAHPPPPGRRRPRSGWCWSPWPAWPVHPPPGRRTSPSRPACPAPPYFDRARPPGGARPTEVLTADDPRPRRTSASSTSDRRHRPSPLPARGALPAAGRRTLGGPQLRRPPLHGRTARGGSGITSRVSPSVDPAQAGELLAHVPREVYAAVSTSASSPAPQGPWVIAILRVERPRSAAAHTDSRVPAAGRGRPGQDRHDGRDHGPAGPRPGRGRADRDRDVLRDGVRGRRPPGLLGPGRRAGHRGLRPTREGDDGRPGRHRRSPDAAGQARVCGPRTGWRLTIRSVGRDTDQWRVFPAGLRPGGGRWPSGTARTGWTAAACAAPTTRASRPS